MINVYRFSRQIIDTFSTQIESCRISTIGIFDDEENLEKLFFPLEKEVEMVYYYGMNEEKLRTEENLFRTITNNVKSKITDQRKVSFGIYPTQYEHDYIYVEYFSPKIQQIVLDTEQETV